MSDLAQTMANTKMSVKNINLHYKFIKCADVSERYYLNQQR